MQRAYAPWFGLIWLTLGAGIAPGVTTTGTILGAVTDPSGAVIMNAEVIVTNVETGETRRFTADSAGNYTFPELKPGSYTVTARAGGFKTKEVKGIVLHVDQKARVDFAMEVGAVTETMEVVGAAPLVNTENAALGDVVTNRQVVNMPLNGRRFLQLTWLTPGATPGAGNSFASSFEGDAVSVNGQRPEDNNFMLDGVDNNVETAGSQAFNPSIDAIQEFKVQASTYSAEFGRAGGAQVSIATKSGTNGLHGTVFEFLRNNHLQARNFFDKGAPGQYKQNQFGGTVGGPIVVPHLYNGRNRSFFFFNYEGLRVVQSQTGTAYVATAEQRGGDFSGGAAITDPFSGAPFPGNRIPSGRLSPVAVKMLALAPLPNGPNPSQAPNYFTSSRALRNPPDQVTARIDQQLRTNDSLSGRFSFQRRHQFSGSSLPAFGGSTRSDPVRNAMLNETHIFSARVLNEFRIGYNRRRTDYVQQNQGHNYAQDLGLPMLSSNPSDFGYPGFSISPYSGLGDGGNNPRPRLDEVAEVNDNFTVIRTAHTFKTGVEFRRVHLYNSVGQHPRGDYTFAPNIFTGNVLANFLLGLPSNTLISMPAVTSYEQYTGLELYGQDDWKVSRRLTLNFGLRYTYNGPWTEKNNHASSFDPATGKLILLGQGGYPRGLYYPNKLNFGPRFGFALRPSGADSMVVRGGYGVFWAVQTGNPPFDQGQNPPFGGYSLQYFANPSDPASLTLANPFPGAGTSNVPQYPQLFVLDLHQKDAYVQQWQLNIQREFARNWLLQVAYVGSKGTHLQIRNDLNQPEPAPGPVQPRRRWPDFGRIYYNAPRGTSVYHSFQAKAEKRFAAGFSVLAAYTFAKAIDMDTGVNVRPQNSLDFHGERGLSDYDVRHRLVASYLYELPFGRGKAFLSSVSPVAATIVGNWKLSGIMSFNTGLPSTPMISFDQPNVGYDTIVARPNRIANGNLSSGRSLNRYWDPNAFVLPPAYSFGSAGRNILTGPSNSNWDFSVLKEFRLSETRWIEFRAEIFNFLNHPNFGMPGNIALGPTFGVISSAAAPRIVQFGLKCYF